MNKEIKTLEDLENYCKKNTGHGINVPPFVYIDKYFEDIEKAYENGYRAGYKEGSNYSVDEEAKEVDNVKNSYLAIKATQRQSCEDEDAAKAFQLGLAFGFGEKYDEMDKVLEEVKKSITPQSCEDAISRQAAIVALDDRMSSLENVDMQIAMGFAKGIIHELPSVTQQSKMGRWLPIEYDGYADGYPVWDKWECSECGYEHNGDEESLTAFCPDCGRKMEVGENG